MLCLTSSMLRGRRGFRSLRRKRHTGAERRVRFASVTPRGKGAERAADAPTTLPPTSDRHALAHPGHFNTVFTHLSKEANRQRTHVNGRRVGDRHNTY
jgi:hypothetical protein